MEYQILISSPLVYSNFLMNNLESTNPTNHPIFLDPNRIIMSKTDLNGVIEFANDYFVEISGYSRAELMGQPHNIIRHPEMPKVIFKLLWDHIQNGKSIYAFVKNLTKNGQTYWVIAKVDPKIDANGNTISYVSNRRGIPAEIALKVEEYYKILLEIETSNSVSVSEKYFNGLLEELNLDYDTFIQNLLGSEWENAKASLNVNNHSNLAQLAYKSNKPIANDIQIPLDPSKTIMSKTDLKGIIQYSNDYFVDVSGYTKEELMGQPHNIIRHPDMPKLVFKIMWDRLKRGEGLYALVKNLTKTGAYYWVIARIDPKYDENGKIDSYFSYRKASPDSAVKRIEPYYKILLSIEKEQKPEIAEQYFKGLLEDKNMTYDEFILNILGTDEKTLNNYFSEVNSINVQSEVSSIHKRNSKPIPNNREILLDPSKIIMSKTNAKGIIEYANDYFMEISGYEQHDLMGEPHNVIRHPDMPKTIFKFLWDTIQKGENIHAIVKNMSKDGKYYWVLTNFEFKYNENNEIVSYYSRRKAAPKEAVIEIEKLYNTLKSIEQKQNMQVALNYFLGMLEEKKITYHQFIMKILGVTENELNQYFDVPTTSNISSNEKKGFVNRLLSK
jgi:PAS domain S-box-containing protein